MGIVQDRDDEFQRLRNAQIYDLTQPYIVDKTPIVDRVALWLSQHLRVPNILELGCGTGLFAEPLLRRLHDFSYIGIDRSAEMIQLFREKTRGTTLHDRVELISGVDLRDASAYDAICRMNCSVMISSQFLQYIPFLSRREASPTELDKERFLHLCNRIIPKDGVLFLFEEILGEDDQETARFGRMWDDYVINHYRMHPELLEKIEAIDPNFVRAFRRSIENPDLMALIRQRRRSARGEMPASLSVYESLFASAGFSAEAEKHPELDNFVLFQLTPVVL